jgi:hypothetical protein
MEVPLGFPFRPVPAMRKRRGRADTLHLTFGHLYWEETVSDINWPEVLVGFVLGLVPLLVGVGYQIYSYLRQPGRPKYRGKFWLYSYDFLDKEAVCERALELSPSLLHRATTASIQDSTTGLTYKGRFLKVGEGGVRYLLLDGVGHPEHVLIVLVDPLSSEFDLAQGILAGVNMEKKPTAGKVVLSKNRLDLVQAKEALHSRVVVRANVRLRAGATHS